MRWLPWLALAACAPADLKVERTLVTDNVHFGEPRADVESWHLANDWTKGSTHDDTDGYFARTHANRPVRVVFRFADDRVRSIAVYVPVACAHDCRDDFHAVDVFDADGRIVDNPIAAGRALEPPPEVRKAERRTLDAMSYELEKRYGAPLWENAEHTAMTWSRDAEEIGLFLQPDSNEVVEIHVAASPAPGAAN
jgi:hypothetical protein